MLGKIPEKEVFMKKTAVYAAALIVIGVLSYFIGYYITVPKTAPESILSEREKNPAQEHYIAKIERDMLFIYEMPENTIYDSMNTESMNFQTGELPALLDGIVFESLTEVYEFLESSMS